MKQNKSSPDDMAFLFVLAAFIFYIIGVVTTVLVTYYHSRS